MDDDLIQKARAVAEELLPAFDMLAAYAYGSRVSGAPRADSDLDVGYFLRGYRDGARLSLSDELALANRLTDRLGVDVDFRDLGGAPLEVRGRIMEDGVRLYSGDFHERVELEGDSYSRYHDYKAEFEELARIRLERIAARGLG
jgi:predicted nucleotidyltransferase